MINCKAKGSKWERDIIHFLEASGYTCTRAAGSMGIWDIVADCFLDSRRIQAKCNSWGTKKERKAMVAYSVPPDVRKQVWRKDDGGRVRMRTIDGLSWVENDISKEMREWNARRAKKILNRNRTED